MLSITVGPVAVPVAPLVLLLAAVAAAWLASRLAVPSLASAAAAAMRAAIVVGLVAARLAHLALHAGAYAGSPASVIDLRDGGWNAAAGVLAFTVWLAWRGTRMPALRRPLAAGAAAGLALWSGGAWYASRAVPDAMPDVRVVDLATGRAGSLASFAAGRPAVVNLWATWCGPCQEEMPTLAAAERRESRVAFLFVDQGESAQAVSSWLGRSRLSPRQVLLDPARSLGAAVGTRGIPATFFYDAQGRLVASHFGVLNPAALEVALRELRGRGP